MHGNIVAVDYDLSSWKYMNFSPPKIKEYLMPPTYRSADPVAPYRIAGYDDAVFAGMGSAYGGKWKPKDSHAARYIGTPNTIKEYFNKNGERSLIKYGDDGYAVKERHFTNHTQPGRHSNPHDHFINWIDPDHHPDPSGPINYFGVPVPEFKSFKRRIVMESAFLPDPEPFESIEEFKRALSWGAEIEFQWKGKDYSCVRYGTNNKITICEAYKEETEKVCETADDALEYIVGGDRLRDVITKVTVHFCSVR